MKRYIKLFLIFSAFMTQPLSGFAKEGNAEIKIGTSGARCIVAKRSGPNDFYYCGKQDTGCYGTNTAFNKNYSRQHQYYHGQCISIRDDYKQETRHFCCCAGNTTEPTKEQKKKHEWPGAGQWKDVTTIHNAHPTWGMWRQEENTTNACTVNGQPGSLTYYVNVCSGITYITGGKTETTACVACPSGSVMRGNHCAKICGDGQAWESASSDTCISCPQTQTQGAVEGVCTQCASTEFYNPGTQSCKKFSEMVQVSQNAHEACWLCGSPGAMWKCFLEVSKNGSLTTPKLKTACSLSGEGAADYNLPDNAVAIIGGNE